MSQAYPCEWCPKSYGTAIDRSQRPHERHAHPKRRNQKRREAAEVPAAGPGRTSIIWTPEETVLLIELNERFKGNRHINMNILEFLPRKTRKQISDKRVYLELVGPWQLEHDVDIELQPASVSRNVDTIVDSNNR
jgi:hypothetical protein